MDTKQRTKPGTEQRTARPETARKAEPAPGAAKATPQRKRTAPVSRQAQKTQQSQKTGKTQQAQQRREQVVAERKRKRADAQKPAQPRPAPEVVYTPPKPFSRNRLLLRLATTVAVVLALTFGISIFFKVSTITVSGMEKYTAWDVRQASGIQEGDNLLTFGKTRARVKILAELPYVEKVRIGIKLPDTVNIEIEELDVVYAIRDQSGGWWLITSEGTVVEQADSAAAGEYTQILGVLLSLPRTGEQAVAVEPLSDPSQESDSKVLPTPVTVRGSDQLAAALQVLQYLEANSVIGTVTSVDVTDLSQLEMWYGKQYQVKLGDTTQLNYKISCVKETVDRLGSYQSGVLDASFTFWTDGVGYTPFS